MANICFYYSYCLFSRLIVGLDPKNGRSCIVGLEEGPPPQKKKEGDPATKNEDGKCMPENNFFSCILRRNKEGGASLAEKIGVAINREWKWVQKARAGLASRSPSIRPSIRQIRPSIPLLNCSARLSISDKLHLWNRKAWKNGQRQQEKNTWNMLKTFVFLPFLSAKISLLFPYSSAKCLFPPPLLSRFCPGGTKRPPPPPPPWKVERERDFWADLPIPPFACPSFISSPFFLSMHQSAQAFLPHPKMKFFWATFFSFPPLMCPNTCQWKWLEAWLWVEKRET